MRLLLLSNSTNFGGAYLKHAEADIAKLFEGVKRIAFVPFAIADQAGYFARARQRFQEFGIETARVEAGPGGRRVVEEAEGLFVGGGNTFRLLDQLQRFDLVDPIRARVLGGMPYLGASAGTGVAAPTIMTTNDMPIVQPRSFAALGLVPFQFNCHYLDPDPGSHHMGETRETRIREFHEENGTPVLGLREGSWVEVEGKPGALRSILRGPSTARLFRRGRDPEEHPTNTALPDLE